MSDRDEVINTAKNLSLRLGGAFIKVSVPMLIGVYLVTGFYSVEQDRIAMLQRFGKVIDAKVQPGMHWALPWPVHKVDKVAVKQTKTIVIDDFGKEFAEDSAAGAFKEATGLWPYCITGDNNIVNIVLVIKYTITDPMSYRFKVTDAEKLLRAAAATTTIHALAGLSVDEILTYGKDWISNEIKLKLQRRLNDLDAGVSISFIELRDVSPPQRVQSAFDDVINAKVEKRKMLNEAESWSNQAVAEARGEAEKAVQDAHAYQREKIDHAQGDASRFLSQLAEFNKAKDVSRRRMYLEFIRSVYPKIKQIVVVDTQGDKKPLKIKLFSK